jgi:superfamily I DNA/RNA helicase
MKPTPEQARAIDARHPAILAIAGPGSGKTATLIERIICLVEDGEDPAKMIVITFTNAAARELRERIEARSPGTKLNFIGTLHAFALRELQAYGQAIGFGKRITILDAEQSAEAMRQAATAAGYRGKIEAVEELRRYVGEIKASPASLTLSQYIRTLKQSSCVDFETLLTEFFALARHGYRNPWKHLFVDEYQDASELDSAIYAAINAENRFFVGDPDQAIYGFRGGSVSGILEKAEPESGWLVIVMSDNFRSGRNICDFANRLIANNAARVEKRTVARAGMGEVIFREFKDPSGEATTILDEIEDAIQRGESVRGLAVLTRGNALALELAEAASGRGIPVRKREKAEVPRDWALCKAAVALLNAPHSIHAARRFISIEQGPVAAAVAVADMAKAQKFSLADSIPDLTTDATAGTLALSLARLRIEPAAIEKVQSIAASLNDPDISAIELAINAEPEESEAGDGVTFATMHGSKGREWDRVWVAGFEQESIPGTAKTRHVDEERRLAFVAFTRARHYLAISFARTRRLTWGKKAFAPTNRSQFIAEAIG